MRRLLFVSLLAATPAVAVFAQQPTTPPPPARITAPSTPAPTPSTMRPPETAAPAMTAPALPQGQTPPGQTPPSGRAPQASTPRPGGPPNAPGSAQRVVTLQNVKVDVTISDSISADVQNKKAVSVIIADGHSGQVRSTSREGIINIDARPSIRQDGRIYLQLTLEYRPELTTQQYKQLQESAAMVARNSYSESLVIMVADGRAMVVSQSADPTSDRKVSVEVTASVLK